MNDKELEIVGTNTSDYHVVRSYFDGNYIRVDAVSKEQAANVKKEAIAGKEE